ncbi:MAG TPA: endopeptidase La [Bacteroidia bacterium]
MKFEIFDKLTLGDRQEDDSELIPLLTNEGDEVFDETSIPNELPILPLRNTVLYPGVVIPITVGRDKSIKLIQDANKGNKLIGVATQKDVQIEDPDFKDLHKIGTVAQILKMLKMPDGTTTCILQGRRKIGLVDEVTNTPYFKATYSIISDKKPSEKDDEFNAIMSNVKDLAIQIIEQSPEIPTEATFAIKNIDSPSFLLHFICSNINASIFEKQQLLEFNSVKERALKVLELLSKELSILELKNQIRNKVKTDIDKQQRDYFLHQQLRQIQEELGEGSTKEIENLKTRAESKKWSAEVADVFNKEIAKLERTNPASPDYGVSMNYVELLLDLPWNEYTEDIFDLKRAKEILDRDHFGMDKVKKRIIEHLAVLKLKGDMRSPILCLVGPPGVGKTSLGKSVAEALGRKYVRVALGGLKDESEIRGHRKTYIGAMPGRIIHNIKKVKSSNPVFILDELDKISSSLNGDPSSALLEVLDPEQNTTFHDNYLDLDYDLSKVFFIATANSLNSIQSALLDRMEVIQLSGYSLEEKVEIALRHLAKKQAAENGISKSDLKLNKKNVAYIIDNYTRESGVRNLERKIGAVARYIAVKKASGEPIPTSISTKLIEEILGPPYGREKYIGNEFAGVVAGLGWTPVGGDILYIESLITKGRGKLTLTGSLGNVMKESALLAFEYFKSKSKDFGIPYALFEHTNIHIHVPEGATPKDGPSAGITMFTSIASAFTQRLVKDKLAMTGEITLRGEVLPVGGIKEKILAAKRGGITDIILCHKNQKDVLEIEQEYLEGLTFHYVSRMEEVAKIALTNKKAKNPLPLESWIPKNKTKPNSK